MSTDSYDDILHRIGHLPKEEQVRLLNELSATLRQSRGIGPRSILELQGLGKEVWGGVDAQDYVRKERSSWNG